METRGESQRDDETVVRAHILIRGIVQGVGFRPFVHRIAGTHLLAGWVLNSTEGVEIEVEGPSASVRAFIEDVSSKAPPMSQIHRIDVDYLPPAGHSTFVIEASHENTSGFPLISPDIATCPECLSELFDPANRRYRYPFINCTNCGPRFTIVQGVPYDRARTTMKSFTMCPACQSEYDDQSNRRFHAQPDACYDCGPSLWLRKSDAQTAAEVASDRVVQGAELPELEREQLFPSMENARIPDPIDEARRLLKAGKILAVKGLGGFHLACDATNAEAVGRLRKRKLRVEKPFAVMVRDLETVGKHCELSDAEAQLLSSWRRPIVLLWRKKQGHIVDEVAPGNKRLGVMLPYAPIHHLLLEPAENGPEALVMTSGNLSEEPIAKDNGEALSRLASLADVFLLHDRPIHVRCDDSVTQVFEGKETIIRRSRGYAPLPVRLPFAMEPVLACGGELKNTFCMTRDNYAFLGQHIGDLENRETFSYFAESIDHMRRIFNLNPSVIAHDLHPDYLSTRYAYEYSDSGRQRRPSASPMTTVAVQHHHAHIAGCMAENGLNERVIGVAFDGTGYGPDGAVWGGEFLVTDYLDFERFAHLKNVPLPGGDAAVRRPSRMALSYLLSAYGDDLPQAELLTGLDSFEVAIIRKQIARGINSPLTSSCGRLFDAVSALAGFRREVTYEGQAAVELETDADESICEAYRFGVSGSRPIEIDSSPVIRAVVGDLLVGVERGIVSAKFHNGLALMVADVCRSIGRETGLNKVCLSGGVFQNRFLLKRSLDALRQLGFETFIHHLVPCNDGGISLGQAIIASKQARMRSA